MRVRGLKPLRVRYQTGVASVAPHAGAWIETAVLLPLFPQLESHPMRVRGLKLTTSLSILHYLGVAPHAGAWIETLNFLQR